MFAISITMLLATAFLSARSYCQLAQGQAKSLGNVVSNRACSISLSGEFVEGGKSVPGSVPVAFTLDQNYPNLFNPTTQICYSVAHSGLAALKVFNTPGQEVKALVSGVQHTGNYVATFNGSGFASGVYFYRLQSGSVSITKKFVLMK